MNNLDKEMIVLNKAFASKEEAIRFCGQKLVDAGCVDSDYVEAMLQRDRMLSVYMGNFIAIPQDVFRTESRRGDDARAHLMD